MALPGTHNIRVDQPGRAVRFGMVSTSMSRKDQWNEAARIAGKISESHGGFENPNPKSLEGTGPLSYLTGHQLCWPDQMVWVCLGSRTGGLWTFPISRGVCRFACPCLDIRSFGPAF